MTLIAVSIAAPDIDQMRARAHEAREAGATLIELRLDTLEGIDVEQLGALCASLRPEAKILLTIRSRNEGGAFDGDDAERISRLIEVGPLADYLDVEWATWNASANIRQKVGLALKRAGHISQASGVEEIDLAEPRRLILSRHDQTTRPTTLMSDLVSMLAEDACDVPKLAWRARTIRDNFEAFELMRTSPKPAIAICMGDDGMMSRVLAGKFGAFATFASLRPGSETAAGQVDLHTLRSLYRFLSIGPKTRVYGVIGDPVAHSLSPAIHNAAFEATKFDAVYLPMRVHAGYESFKAFMVEVLARPWLDICGLSITAPHKENAFRFVTEQGGIIDPVHQRLGAINTITLTRPGSAGATTAAPGAPGSACDHRSSDAKIAGINTDYEAGEKLLRDAFAARESLAGLRVSILGAGGVARAFVALLSNEGCEVTIYNRTRARAAALAAEFYVRDADWDERPGKPDLLINCTPVGQSPKVVESPTPTARLTGITVFDTVYSPNETRLIRETSQAGCRTVAGLELLLAQAGMQFETWTARTAPMAVMRSAAGKEIHGTEGIMDDP